MNTKRRRAPNGFRIQPNSDSSFHLYERGYIYPRRYASRAEALSAARRAYRQSRSLKKGQ